MKEKFSSGLGMLYVIYVTLLVVILDKSVQLGLLGSNNFATQIFEKMNYTTEIGKGSTLFFIIFFAMLIILGKLSPHRMFTHKWFGTTLFCFSVYTLGNTYLTIGFTMGYVLHIVCDRFSPRGKKLKFFEFKLPCRNSKNKINVTW